MMESTDTPKSIIDICILAEVGIGRMGFAHIEGNLIA
jgi:hypothetical protein